MEPIHPLLASAGGSVEQQATRRTGIVSGSTLNQGRRTGSQGVTAFLKVTGFWRQTHRLGADAGLPVVALTRLALGQQRSSNVDSQEA
jgi:hypothetical protein